MNNNNDNNLSRGKKILAILNKSLKERFTPQNQQKKRKSNDDYLDPDYQPPEDYPDSSQVKKTIKVLSHYKLFNSSQGTSFQDLSNLKCETNILDSKAVSGPLYEKQLNLYPSKGKNLDENSTTEEDSLLIVAPIIEQLIDLTISEISKKVTKKGTLRKRKKFDTPLSTRIAAKKMKKVLEHAIKPPCPATCFLKCSIKFNEEHRKIINQQYWESSKDVQKNFLFNLVKRETIKRRTVVVSAEPLRKSTSIHYFLKDDTGDRHRVCKVFFLGTIGYNSHDDRFLRSIISSANEGTAIYQPKKHTRTTPNKKVDRNIIIEHINSFGPTISHYRRAHAPNRLYLPSDINIAYMHKHFQDKYSSMKVSYALYRQVVADQNISFSKLGHEECWSCEIFELHCKQIGHDKNNIPDDCDVCQKWNTHIQKANISREAYQEDSKSDREPAASLIVSADLQKVW